MNSGRLSREGAKTIEGWVKRSCGRIIRVDGRNCQVRIEGIVAITTLVLEEWLELGANVYFIKGFMEITNWPEAEKVFKVGMKGKVSVGGVTKALCDEYGDENVISVEEVENDKTC